MLLIATIHRLNGQVVLQYDLLMMLDLPLNRGRVFTFLLQQYSWPQMHTKTQDWKAFFSVGHRYTQMSANG